MLGEGRRAAPPSARTLLPTHDLLRKIRDLAGSCLERALQKWNPVFVQACSEFLGRAFSDGEPEACPPEKARQRPAEDKKWPTLHCTSVLKARSAEVGKIEKNASPSIRNRAAILLLIWVIRRDCPDLPAFGRGFRGSARVCERSAGAALCQPQIGPGEPARGAIQGSSHGLGVSKGRACPSKSPANSKPGGNPRFGRQ